MAIGTKVDDFGWVTLNCYNFPGILR